MAMSTLRELNAKAMDRNAATGGRDLATVARALLVGGSWELARNVMHTWARGSDLTGGWTPTPRAMGFVSKAAVDPGGTATGTWGSELGDPDNTAAITAFLASLRTVGVFDRLIADGAMLSVPLRSRFAIATGGAAASTVSAGSVKPLTRCR
jgi:hypothetical protein